MSDIGHNKVEKPVTEGVYTSQQIMSTVLPQFNLSMKPRQDELVLLVSDSA